RGDRVLRLDVDDELVEVRALLDSGRLDLVGHGEHRRVDRVDRDAADLLVTGLVLLRGDVAAATLDGELHLDGALVVEGGDVQVRVVHLDAGRRVDVGGGDRPGTGLAQVHHDRLVVLAGDDEGLDVEDDLGDVLLHPGDRGELVEHDVEADRGQRGTRDAREQGTTQGVADGVAEAGLEGLDDEPRTVVGEDLFAEVRALCDEHGVLPSHGRPLYDAS